MKFRYGPVACLTSARYEKKSGPSRRAQTVEASLGFHRLEEGGLNSVFVDMKAWADSLLVALEERFPCCGDYIHFNIFKPIAVPKESDFTSSASALMKHIATDTTANRAALVTQMRQWHAI